MREQAADLLARHASEFDCFQELLIRWQNKINLVGRGTVSRIYQRHFLDSAQVALHAPLDAVWADLGSGAGFPGLVTGILQKDTPGGVTHLIESDQRKAAFLREVSRETQARVFVHADRVERVLAELEPQVITSRAMTSLANLIQLTREKIETGSICVFMKGEKLVDELTEVGRMDNLKIEVRESVVQAGSVIVLIQKQPNPNQSFEN